MAENTAFQIAGSQSDNKRGLQNQFIYIVILNPTLGSYAEFTISLDPDSITSQIIKLPH